MKKLFAILLMGAMLLSLAACGSSASSTAESTEPASSESTVPAASEEESSEEESEAPAAAATDVKLAVLLPGTINDNGWNAGAYSGLKTLEENYGIETAYTENVANSDMEDFLRGYADQGYNMIVCHGTQFIDAAKKVAPEYPDAWFLISNADVDNSMAPNIACFGTVYTGYLAGAVAAAVSESGTVAVLGGEQSASITPIVELFIEGAKYVNPDINVLSGYIGSLTDADKAKDMALNYINEGADVVCASANSAGLGVIQAADEAGVYAIGFNSDQYEAAPDAVIVSVLRNFPVMFDTMYTNIANGTMEAKVYPFGVAEGGTILSDWHGWDEKLPQEALDKIQSVFDDFEAGKIQMTYMDYMK